MTGGPGPAAPSSSCSLQCRDPIRSARSGGSEVQHKTRLGCRPRQIPLVKQNRLQILEGPRLEFEIPRGFDCRTHKCTALKFRDGPLLLLASIHCCISSLDGHFVSRHRSPLSRAYPGTLPWQQDPLALALAVGTPMHRPSLSHGSPPPVSTVFRSLPP